VKKRNINVVQKGEAKDMISKVHTKVTFGVFIPGEFLSQAEITEENIEIEGISGRDHDRYIYDEEK